MALYRGPNQPGREIYLRLRLGMLNMTLSLIWGSRYLPMFLLKDRSLTLINMAFLMVLMMVCDFLPTMEKFHMI